MSRPGHAALQGRGMHGKGEASEVQGDGGAKGGKGENRIMLRHGNRLDRRM